MNKEQIKIQIEALKSTIKVLENELNKPNKFEFKYTPSGAIRIYTEGIETRCGILPSAQENFRYRQTETNAKADFQLQKELMCIGALAEQIDLDYKAKVDWGNSIQEKYYIVYNYKYNKYEIIRNYQNRTLGVVYIPKDVAEKVCEILNNKGVEL